jgi:hypothetical protein
LIQEYLKLSWKSTTCVGSTAHWSKTGRLVVFHHQPLTANYYFKERAPARLAHGILPSLDAKAVTRIQCFSRRHDFVFSWRLAAARAGFPPGGPAVRVEARQRTG